MYGKVCVYMKNNNYVLPKRANLRRIKISDITIEKPNLKNVYDPKVNVISKWLIKWIDTDLASKKIFVNDLLPAKRELAYFLGVSIGTMQTAIRYVEDAGYVESKQCIGTMIRNNKEKTKSLRKLTSKRELAIKTIKKYLIDKNYKIGQVLPSSRILSVEVNKCSANTTRLALEFLGRQGIIKHRALNNIESGWTLQSTDFTVDDTSEAFSSETLVTKIEKDLKDYINKNCKIGDRLPVHAELSSTFKASIKTIHDGLSTLIKEGILLPRRGRYGTTVIKMPNDKNADVKKETSIFASAEDAAFYSYEKTQSYLKKLIAKKYKIGEKLPSIFKLAKELHLSPNTIRKSFHNLGKEGYVAFSRGRYGGTFVIDIPEVDEQSFKWIAVNPKYADIYKSAEVKSN